MYAGDFRNSLENVRRELRRLKYPLTVDYSALLRGQQCGFIEIYRYLFCEYNQSLTKYLSEKGFDLTGMADKKFMESVYRCVRDIFNAKPAITLAQFFSSGFAERKMEMLVLICQGIQGYAERLCKPTISKSAHSRAILESLSNRRSKDKEPEIIHIHSLPKTDKHSVKTSKKSRLKTTPLGDASCSNKNLFNQNPEVKREETSSIIREDCVAPYVSESIPLSVIEALPLDIPSQSTATQTLDESHTKLLENISVKLDNIFARITLLESRMSLLEDRLPDVTDVEHQGNSNCNPFLSPPPTTSLTGRNENINQLETSELPGQRRRPVEAVVINQTNQPPPPIKLLRFYEREVGDKNSCSIPSHQQSVGKLELPGHYSPSLYRLTSDDQRQYQEDISNEDGNSDVTSESDVDIPRYDQRVEQELPVKLSEIESDNGTETFQSQVTRIQEMIKSTNILLNKA